MLRAATRMLASKRVLIVGSGGQVGLDLIPLLRERGETVRCCDIIPRPPGLSAEVGWDHLDVTNAGDVQRFIAEAEPDRIYHLAAMLSATGEKHPNRCFDVNLLGTRNVLDAAVAAPVKPQIIFTSTIAAFGPGLPQPVGDEVSMRPQTMYGVTKVAGELLCEYYSRKFGLDCRGVRFPGLISAGIPGGGTTDYALWMWVFALCGRPYSCFVSAPSRVPFMYMPDALHALCLLADAPRAGLKRTIYNIAAFSPSAGDLAAEVVARVKGAAISFKPCPRRQAILDGWPQELDDSRAREEWGWKPKFGVSEMCDDLLPKMAAIAADAIKLHKE